ncbi:MAG: phage tail sheath family protein, partial [Cyanobacteria bacterium P01_D01_bin.2]
VNLSVAGFVGFTEDIRGDAELFEPTLVTSWSQYLENFSKVGSDGFTEFGAYLPFAVKGWFENGGGRCWVVSIGTELPKPETDPVIDEADIPAALTPVSTSGNKDSLTFQLRPEREAEGRVRVFIEPDEPLPSDDPDDEPFNSGEFFKVKIVPGDGDPEEFRHLTMQNPEGVSPEELSAGTYVVEALNNSEYIDIELTAQEGLPLAQRPANGVYEVRPRPIPYRTRRWYKEMYGSVKRRSGVQGLFEVDEVAMVACPDLMLVYQRGLLSLQQVHGVMEMMITNCETAAPGPAYRMAVIDPPPVKPRKSDLPVLPEQQKPQDVEAWRMDSFGRFTQFGALYYP